jgi:hypothetical protein
MRLVVPVYKTERSNIKQGKRRSFAGRRDRVQNSRIGPVLLEVHSKDEFALESLKYELV